MMRSIRSLSFATLVRLFGILCLLTGLLLYVQFQARNMLTGPSVLLEGTYEPLQHTRHIALAGKAENIVKLTLNGREIHTDESGAFTQTLVLENGYTIMELKAQDRFGRVTSLKREYVYAPGSESITE